MTDEWNVHFIEQHAEIEWEDIMPSSLKNSEYNNENDEGSGENI